MTISTNDFKAIAEALHNCRPAYVTQDNNPFGASEDLQLGQITTWEGCCIAIADTPSTLNSRFRHDLFLATCRAP